MESIEQEDGRRRRRSYDEAFKRDAVRLVSEEKYSFKAARVVMVNEELGKASHDDADGGNQKWPPVRPQVCQHGDGSGT